MFIIWGYVSLIGPVGKEISWSQAVTFIFGGPYRRIRFANLTNHSARTNRTIPVQGQVFRKSRKLFEPEKPFQKLRSPYSKRLVFYYDFKIRKGKFFCKISCLEMSSFLTYEGNYGTRNAPEKFREFRETDPRTGLMHRYRKGHGSIPGEASFFQVSFWNCSSSVCNCNDLWHTICKTISLFTTKSTQTRSINPYYF